MGPKPSAAGRPWGEPESAMRELRLQTLVDENHVAQIQLPEDVRQGPIEVIVRLPEAIPQTPKLPLAEFLDRLVARPWTGRSREEIDRQIQEERDSWD